MKPMLTSKRRLVLGGKVSLAVLDHGLQLNKPGHNGGLNSFLLRMEVSASKLLAEKLLQGSKMLTVLTPSKAQLQPPEIASTA